MEVVLKDAGGFVRIRGRVHRGRRRGEGPGAVVDLEEAVTVAGVADDVGTRVAPRAARFLGRDRGQELRIETPLPRPNRDDGSR